MICDMQLILKTELQLRLLPINTIGAISVQLVYNMYIHACSCNYRNNVIVNMSHADGLELDPNGVYINT